MSSISRIMTDTAVVDDRTEPQTAAGGGRKNLFVQGQSGNPNGRPRGSRNKLTSLFVDDLYAAWQTNGKDVLMRLAKDDPGALARLVALILPKDVNLSLEVQNYVVRAPTVAQTSAEWQAIALKPEQSSSAEIIDLKPVDVSPTFPIGD